MIPKKYTHRKSQLTNQKRKNTIRLQYQQYQFQYDKQLEKIQQEINYQNDQLINLENSQIQMENQKDKIFGNTWQGQQFKNFIKNNNNNLGNKKKSRSKNRISITNSIIKVQNGKLVQNNNYLQSNFSNQNYKNKQTTNNDTDSTHKITSNIKNNDNYSMKKKLSISSQSNHPKKISNFARLSNIQKINIRNSFKNGNNMLMTIVDNNDHTNNNNQIMFQKHQIQLANVTQQLLMLKQFIGKLKLPQLLNINQINKYFNNENDKIKDKDSIFSFSNNEMKKQQKNNENKQKQIINKQTYLRLSNQSNNLFSPLFNFNNRNNSESYNPNHFQHKFYRSLKTYQQRQNLLQAFRIIQADIKQIKKQYQAYQKIKVQSLSQVYYQLQNEIQKNNKSNKLSLINKNQAVSLQQQKQQNLLFNKMQFLQQNKIKKSFNQEQLIQYQLKCKVYESAIKLGKSKGIFSEYQAESYMKLIQGKNLTTLKLIQTLQKYKLTKLSQKIKKLQNQTIIKLNLINSSYLFYDKNLKIIQALQQEYQNWVQIHNQLQIVNIQEIQRFYQQQNLNHLSSSKFKRNYKSHTLTNLNNITTLHNLSNQNNNIKNNQPTVHNILNPLNPLNNNTNQGFTQNGVLILGANNVGKTTLFLTMAGQRMKKREMNIIDDQTSQIIRQINYQAFDQQKSLKYKTSPFSASCLTRQPYKLQAPKKCTFPQELSLIDTASFEIHHTSTEADIMNVLYMYETIQQIKKLRIIILISSQLLQEDTINIKQQNEKQLKEENNYKLKQAQKHKHKHKNKHKLNSQNQYKKLWQFVSYISKYFRDYDQIKQSILFVLNKFQGNINKLKHACDYFLRLLKKKKYTQNISKNNKGSDKTVNNQIKDDKNNQKNDIKQTNQYKFVKHLQQSVMYKEYYQFQIQQKVKVNNNNNLKKQKDKRRNSYQSFPDSNQDQIINVNEQKELQCKKIGQQQLLKQTITPISQLFIQPRLRMLYKLLLKRFPIHHQYQNDYINFNYTLSSIQQLRLKKYYLQNMICKLFRQGDNGFLFYLSQLMFLENKIYRIYNIKYNQKKNIVKSKRDLKNSVIAKEKFDIIMYVDQVAEDIINKFKHLIQDYFEKKQKNKLKEILNIRNKFTNLFMAGGDLQFISNNNDIPTNYNQQYFNNIKSSTKIYPFNDSQTISILIQINSTLLNMHYEFDLLVQQKYKQIFKKIKIDPKQVHSLQNKQWLRLVIDFTKQYFDEEKYSIRKQKIQTKKLFDITQNTIKSIKINTQKQKETCKDLIKQKNPQYISLLQILNNNQQKIKKQIQQQLQHINKQINQFLTSSIIFRNLSKSSLISNIFKNNSKNNINKNKYNELNIFVQKIQNVLQQLIKKYKRFLQYKEIINSKKDQNNQLININNKNDILKFDQIIQNKNLSYINNILKQIFTSQINEILLNLQNYSHLNQIKQNNILNNSSKIMNIKQIFQIIEKFSQKIKMFKKCDQQILQLIKGFYKQAIQKVKLFVKQFAKSIDNQCKNQQQHFKNLNISLKFPQQMNCIIFSQQVIKKYIQILNFILQSPLLRVQIEFQIKYFNLKMKNYFQNLHKYLQKHDQKLSNLKKQYKSSQKFSKLSLEQSQEFELIKNNKLNLRIYNYLKKQIKECVIIDQQIKNIQEYLENYKESQIKDNKMNENENYFKAQKQNIKSLSYLKSIQFRHRRFLESQKKVIRNSYRSNLFTNQGEIKYQNVENCKISKNCNLPFQLIIDYIVLEQCLCQKLRKVYQQNINLNFINNNKKDLQYLQNKLSVKICQFGLESNKYLGLFNRKNYKQKSNLLRSNKSITLQLQQQFPSNNGTSKSINIQQIPNQNQPQQNDSKRIKQFKYEIQNLRSIKLNILNKLVQYPFAIQSIYLDEIQTQNFRQNLNLNIVKRLFNMLFYFIKLRQFFEDIEIFIGSNKDQIKIMDKIKSNSNYIGKNNNESNCGFSSKNISINNINIQSSSKNLIDIYSPIFILSQSISTLSALILNILSYSQDKFSLIKQYILNQIILDDRIKMQIQNYLKFCNILSIFYNYLQEKEQIIQKNNQNKKYDPLKQVEQQINQIIQKKNFMKEIRQSVDKWEGLFYRVQKNIDTIELGHLQNITQTLDKPQSIGQFLMMLKHQISFFYDLLFEINEKQNNQNLNIQQTTNSLYSLLYKMEQNQNQINNQEWQSQLKQLMKDQKDPKHEFYKLIKLYEHHINKVTNYKTLEFKFVEHKKQELTNQIKEYLDEVSCENDGYSNTGDKNQKSRNKNKNQTMIAHSTYESGRALVQHLKNYLQFLKNMKLKMIVNFDGISEIKNIQTLQKMQKMYQKSMTKSYVTKSQIDPNDWKNIDNQLQDEDYYKTTNKDQEQNNFGKSTNIMRSSNQVKTAKYSSINQINSKNINQSDNMPIYIKKASLRKEITNQQNQNSLKLTNHKPQYSILTQNLENQKEVNNQQTLNYLTKMKKSDGIIKKYGQKDIIYENINEKNDQQNFNKIKKKQNNNINYINNNPISPSQKNKSKKTSIDFNFNQSPLVQLCQVSKFKIQNQNQLKNKRNNKNQDKLVQQDKIINEKNDHQLKKKQSILKKNISNKSFKLFKGKVQWKENQIYQ